MKKFKNLFKSVMILAMISTLVAATGNMYAATGITAGMGLFSAAVQLSPQFKSMAFSSLPTIPDFTAKTVEELEELSFKDLAEYRQYESEFTSKTLEH